MTKETATVNFFATAEPIVRKFCRIPYFRNTLGENEIYSISHAKLMQYFREKQPLPDKSPVPKQLWRILYNELVNQIHRQEIRCKYQQTRREEYPQEDTDAAALTELLPADSSCEPETRVLREEMARDVEEALNRLKPAEQEVLRSLYYEGKSSRVLAAEMHVTPQYVSQVKKQGLARMRNLLKAKYWEKE